MLTTDGDTSLDALFIERARRVLDADPRLGGVSAACLGKPLAGTTAWNRMLLLAQRAEYARFAEMRLRRNVHTMSGGSFYRAAALDTLLALRPAVFEERPGGLVEDYETTLALKQLGWKITSNQGCVAYTDLMPTLRTLIDQRTRWVRGTVDEWRRYGWCRATWLSIVGMLVGLLGIAYAGIWLTSSIIGMAAHGGTPVQFLLLATFWSLYQGWQVRHRGWRIILWEIVLLPEAVFNLIRNYWLIRAIAASYAWPRSVMVLEERYYATAPADSDRRRFRCRGASGSRHSEPAPQA